MCRGLRLFGWLVKNGILLVAEKVLPRHSRDREWTKQHLGSPRTANYNIEKAWFGVPDFTLFPRDTSQKSDSLHGSATSSKSTATPKIIGTPHRLFCAASHPSQLYAESVCIRMAQRRETAIKQTRWENPGFTVTKLLILRDGPILRPPASPVNSNSVPSWPLPVVFLFDCRL